MSSSRYRWPDEDDKQTKLPGSWIESNNTRPVRYASQASQSRRSKDAYRPHSRAENRTKSHRLTRDELCDFADLTLKTLDSGSYTPPGSNMPYNLAEKIIYTNENTEYIPPDDAEMAGWAEAELEILPQNRCTGIKIKEYSTLVGARLLNSVLQEDVETKNKKIGVLNFASAKKPGGGFVNGAQAQEESIARSSTLYPSLITDVATEFYSHYVNDPDNPYYTHAMVYSPNVVLIRNDKGEWKKPVKVDVLTSAAVNAGEVRQNLHWAEDMRLLRARVKAAEASRVRATEKSRTREADRRRQREEQRKRLMAESRANAAELRRKNGQNKTGRVSEDDTAPAPAAIETDKMDVDEESPTRAAEAETEQLHQTDTNVELGAPISEQGQKLEDTQAADFSEISRSIDSRPASNVAEIQSPRTPAPEALPLSVLLDQAEIDINTTMRERMGRLLYLFYKRGARHLILGAFGTGVFQNNVETVAQMFHEFLVQPTGKFYNVFDSIVFAILGEPTIRDFRKVFKNDVSSAIKDGDDGEEDTASSIEEQQDGKDGEDQAALGNIAGSAEQATDGSVDNVSSTSMQVSTATKDETIGTTTGLFDTQDQEHTEGMQLEIGDDVTTTSGPLTNGPPPVDDDIPSQNLYASQQHGTMPRTAPI